MAKGSGRRSRRRELQASHQKNWMIGAHVVQETIAVNAWPIAELFVAEDLQSQESQHILKLASQRTLKISRVTRDRLTELCHSRHHQGVAARMGEFPYRDLDWLKVRLVSSEGPGLPACVVICDRIMDAHNFGAILRCCDAMSVAAVVIGQHEQAGVTPHVARASSGAVNFVPVVLVAYKFLKER